MRFLPVCALFVALAAVPMFADGKATFDAKCKGCHAADGTGNPGMAKMMKVTLRPLGGPDVQAKSDADLTKNITEGIGKMPKQALDAKTAADVVAYLRTLKK